MGLFQRSVLSKFLKQQDKDAVAKAYKKFSKHFHNAHIQENIRNSKEEQYQEGFLRELFVDVFGYTLNPQPKYNLTTELKNEKGAKKADGAILKEGNALGVIELKGTDTKDLEKVRQQAFDYKANQSGCVYVITSNFEKLRFYINNAVEWEEFDLFTINEQRFELLYLCLSAENLLNNVPLRIKEASIVEEESITKKFYADYSLFKRELYRDLVKRNMRNEVFRNVLAAEESVSRADKNIKLSLFKKSQKLIDRFLFIFFAEDRGLLPPNSTLQILDEYDKLKAMDAHVPLYDRFKLYFNYLDQGRKGTAEKAEIFAYNGGLFKPDTTLDSLLIDDDLLYKHARSLAKYDFESQVDVNILGHIFENSLNEIESVNAEIEGVDFDKQKTKRKKDGVFYTPKYITKYIVDNTVGKLCQEKKAELGIIDEEYTSNRQKDTKRKLLDKLEQYRSWLLEITICDPACGSGAFLNQALDFLINEHRSIDELQASLLGGGLVFPDIENTILEKNIYGVDLNEESVEIAKLSLWLRTAQPRRKLNDLNNNIKCGNSLIDSKAVAGDKAFSWEKEFPEVFAKAGTEPGRSGGFDVVIGNPPYIKEAVNKSAFNGLHNAPYYQGKMDLWTFFGCVGIDLLKNDGIISFISPNNWISNTGASIFRNKMLNSGILLKYIDFNDFKVFKDAGIQTMIYVYRKQNNIPESYLIDYLKFKEKNLNEVTVAAVVSGDYNNDSIEKYLAEFKPRTLVDTNITFMNGSISRLINKIEIASNYKIDAKDIGNGIDVLQDFLSSKHLEKMPDKNLSPGRGVLVLTNSEIEELGLNEDEKKWLKPYYGTKQINRYFADQHGSGLYILYANRDFRENINKYPNLKRHLDYYAPILTSAFAPYGLHRAREEKFFSKPAIYGHRKTVETSFSFVEFPCYVTRAFMIIQTTDFDLKTLTAVLNSSVINFWFKNNGKLQGSQLQIDKEPLTKVPIVRPDSSISSRIANKVDKIQELNNSLNVSTNKFLSYLYMKEKISTTVRLQVWHDLEFSVFINELNKAIKTVGGEKLSKTDEMEWMDLFETKKKEAQMLKAEIERTEKEIDQLVYELYGLTEEEIKIVEAS